MHAVSRLEWWKNNERADGMFSGRDAIDFIKCSSFNTCWLDTRDEQRVVLWHLVAAAELGKEVPLNCITCTLVRILYLQSQVRHCSNYLRGRWSQRICTADCVELFTSVWRAGQADTVCKNCNTTWYVCLGTECSSHLWIGFNWCVFVVLIKLKVFAHDLDYDRVVLFE